MKISSSDKKMLYYYGKGNVYIIKEDPKELVLSPGKDSAFAALNCII